MGQVKPAIDMFKQVAEGTIEAFGECSMERVRALTTLGAALEMDGQ